MIYHKPVLLADGLIQFLPRLYAGQVQNRAAAIANKVTVRGNNRIKPLLSLDHAHALYQTMLPKKR